MQQVRQQRAGEKARADLQVEIAHFAVAHGEADGGDQAFGLAPDGDERMQGALQGGAGFEKGQGPQAFVGPGRADDRHGEGTGHVGMW